MLELSTEQRFAILSSTKYKVMAGYVLGTCHAAGPEKAANPSDGYCLRGAIERAGEECGLSHDDADNLSHQPELLGLDLAGVNPCLFSDEKGKDGCLGVLDKALAKIAA